MITHVVTKVGVVFLMLAVGALARMKRIITDETLDSLCKIVLSVTLPFLFIYILSTRCNADSLTLFWRGPLFAAAIVAVGYAAARAAAALLSLPAERRGTFTVAISFQNTAFMGLPIALALFGEEGVFVTILFSLGFNLLYWTFGVRLFGGPGKGTSGVGLFKNLINAPMIALVIGALLGFFCIRLPEFLLDGSRILGNATVPLAMLVVGSILAAGVFGKRVLYREMAAIVLCRLVIVPLVFLGVVAYFKEMTQVMRYIIVLQACMPTASTSPLLARRFGGDYDLAAGAVFFTTLASIVTVPIFLSLV